jgi:hypothetical protein
VQVENKDAVRKQEKRRKEERKLKGSCMLLLYMLYGTHLGPLSLPDHPATVHYGQEQVVQPPLSGWNIDTWST